MPHAWQVYTGEADGWLSIAAPVGTLVRHIGSHTADVGRHATVVGPDASDHCSAE